MVVREIYEKLLKANRPKDFFGEIESIQDLHDIYKNTSKLIHPDVVSNEDSYYASEAFIVLHRLYVRGLNEYDNGLYDVKSSSEEYKKSLPIFQINYGEKRYEFFKKICVGEVAEIYEGICDKQPVCIKIPISTEDSELISREYEILSRIHHQSLPYVEDKFSINNATCFTMRKVEGISATELMKEYPLGVPSEHVLWMLERLLSVVGFLHIHRIVHGNIKPENLIVTKQNHNVTLMGFSFAIPNADRKSARYQIVNDFFTADEVSKKARVEPSSDIFSVGKIGIYLLGGNVEDNSMPVTIDSRICNFISKMVEKDKSERAYDAWKLYKELQTLRTSIYGPKRFITLD